MQVNASGTSGGERFFSLPLRPRLPSHVHHDGMTRSVLPASGRGRRIMTMKSVLVAASVFLALFTGCRNADVKKPTAVPTAAVHAPKSEVPYYYGLIEEYQTILAVQTILRQS
jgi:hypothetical protein